MMTPFEMELHDAVVRRINERLKAELGPIADRIIDELVASYALNLMGYVSVRNMGQEIVISIRKEKA